MDLKASNSFQFLFQGIGMCFVAVFLAAFLFSIPTTKVLHGQPVYHWLLATFGGVFLILMLAAAAITIATNRK